MKPNKRSCVISVIGRPNVGKSTIFNRIMKKSFKAMAYDQPGVTRDRHYGIATIDDQTCENSLDVIMVDTGGFYPEKVETVTKMGKRKTAEPFFNIMADHAKLAIDESDLVLMVVDVREGLLPFDKTICDYIRTTKKTMWLLVNKFDSDKQWGDEADFYELGLPEESFFIVSAEHNRGLVTLNERIFLFADNFETEDEHDIQRGVKPNHDVIANVAIIGAPNAGKSTLLNQFVGAKRALVSDIAGTTVDPIEGYFDLFFGQDVAALNARENQFRKKNSELLGELDDFQEELDDAELLAFGQMPDEYKGGVNYDEDIETEDSELEFEDVDNDLYSIEDLEKSLDNAKEESIIESHDDVKEVAKEAIKDNFNPFRSVKLVDTAGIRKQKNVEGFIEEQSVYRSLKAITEADVIIYMIDATKGISHQDRRLCDIAIEKGKSIIICLNKTDLINDILKDKKRKKEWLLDLRATIPWLSFCELITVSAKTGSHMHTLKTSLKKTILVRSKKVTTGKLNKLVSYLVDKYPVMLHKTNGTVLRVKYASMLKAEPPTILLFTNKSKGIPKNYRKYLTNGIRKEFNIINTPVHLIFRTTTDIEKRMKRTQ
ncbi:MAG: GTP-binding protein [Halobacteriovoraceae bacterium]|nr:GTP-binding protein [Halobacteriovoraceae bacterium]